MSSFRYNPCPKCGLAAAPLCEYTATSNRYLRVACTDFYCGFHFKLSLNRAIAAKREDALVQTEWNRKTLICANCGGRRYKHTPQGKCLFGPGHFQGIPASPRSRDLYG